MKQFSDSYLEILTGELKGINLTRILDSDEFFVKQIEDSILPLEVSPFFKVKLKEAKVLVDIGFGGGFPILPIAKQMPEIQCVGLEARDKKVKAVTRIAEVLELSNVKLHHLRCENILFDCESVITLKAVGKISDFLEKLEVRNATTVFFYKGPNVEAQESISHIPVGWKLISNVKYQLSNNEERSLLCYQSTKVPRGTNKRSNIANKKLVKLSSLL